MLYLGSDTADLVGFGYEISGALDEVCIYDEALGAESVAALFALDDCANHGSSAGAAPVPLSTHEPARLALLLLLILAVALYGLWPERSGT